jgi:hypothetical protein
VACDLTELRRKFPDAVAYICDTEKTGPSCTAAALEQDAHSKYNLWIAANDNKHAEAASSMAEELVEILDGVTNHNRVGIEAELLRFCVGKASGRISNYQTRMKKNGANELAQDGK